MWKIIRLAVVFILAVLVILEVTGIQLVSANPELSTNWIGGTVPADNSTKPPTIAFQCEQNTNFTSSNISIPIQVSVGESTTARSTRIKEIYFTLDEQTNYTSVYKYTPAQWNMSEPMPDNFFNSPPAITQLSTNLNLTNVPEGKHVLSVYAVEEGTYVERKESEESIFGYVTITYIFYTNSSSLLSFTIDTIPPKIWLSIENSTYYSSELPLDFKVDESISKLSYSLDNQPNVTLSGNITLTGLTQGNHNIVVFAEDTTGNVTRQIITFNIAQPFPILLAVIAIIVLCGGTLTLFGIYKRKSPSKTKLSLLRAGQ